MQRFYKRMIKAIINTNIILENGVIFGWDTPVANPKNYDENGHFYIPVEEPKERRR